MGGDNLNPVGLEYNNKIMQDVHIFFKDVLCIRIEKNRSGAHEQRRNGFYEY